jgi:SAM-dependent methyltransferase
MSEVRVRPYRQLAEYYDRIFASSQACGAAARERYLGRLLPSVETICDLAAGTGTTALEFARQGRRVYAVDLSPAMCRLARRKARAAGVKLKVLRADMRDFELPEAVDLVLCQYDALNHVPERADLGRVFECVAHALRSGGHFFFDVNNLKSFREAWPSTWFLEEPDVAAVLHGGYDETRQRAYSNVEWFIRQGRLWRRERERVEEVCWSAAEIRAALAGAGLDLIRQGDGLPFYASPVTQRGHRTLYLARRAR